MRIFWGQEPIERTQCYIHGAYSQNSRGNLTDKFRPISLCNSFYKIILKFLTSRFFSVVYFIISPQKTRFVLGRHILDSIMMVHEVIYSMEAGKREGFLLKLDLSKAYRKVDYSFLKAIL